MSFRILGALEAQGPGGVAVPLGPPKQRALLTILLLRAGELIPAEQLIDELWGEEPPRTAAHSIQIYVSELRRILAPIVGPTALLTRPPGYLLEIPDGDLDATRFERLARDGAHALAGRDRATGVRLLQEALTLWRGPALSDFTYEDFAQPYIRRLNDLHLDVIETLAAAQLEAGRVGEVLTLLETAIREDPLRERSRELLMLALYRAGRHAEALRTFENLREQLDEELGLDPSPVLRALQERIILHDPALGAVAPAAVGAGKTRNPYKGLSAFTEEDSGNFFGRTMLVERLARTIAEGARLIGLVGPSGSGKSSALAAGLIATVRSTWEVQVVSPDQAGLVQLDAILASRERRLIVIDQFEEVFTSGEDSLPSRFLALLGRAATDPDSEAAVVLAMRGDFYDRPLLYPSFAQVFLPGVVNILPMTVEELEEAVVRPAERAGVTVEPALVATLIADTADEPGALPLLQYALTELFERRSGSRLTLASYRELGGLRGVLSRRAEEAYAALGPDEQRTATQVFLRLVRPGRGTGDSRRRIPLSELTDMGLDPVALSAVVEAYGRHRLLSFDRSERTGAATVEVAHEALLWEWDRLAGWIDRHRTALRRHEAFVAALEEWEEAAREPGYLLTGTRLEEFAAWSTGGAIRLTARERDFLESSRAAQVSARVAAQASATEIERLRRRSRNRLAALAGAVVLLVIGSGAGISLLAARPSTVALLLHDAGTVDDLAEDGFNRAVSDFGFIAIRRDSDVETADQALESLSLEAPDLIVVFTLDTDVATIARRYPEIMYVARHDAGAGANIRNMRFADHEGSFLAGAAAALQSETGTIGFVGGMDYPPIWSFQAGYEAGARMIDPDVRILSTYLAEALNYDGFTSPHLADFAARAMYGDGADVIFHAAGDSGTGVFAAADALSVDGLHLWAIGVDVDQYFIGGINEAAWRQHILTSMLKRIDVAVYQSLADEADGTFTAGAHVLGLESEAMALAYSGGYIEPFRERLESLRDEIIRGEIDVPCVPTSRAAEAASLGIAGCTPPT